MLINFVLTLQFAARAAKISKRQQVVKEIFESEYAYIAQLNTIVNVSHITLTYCLSLLSSLTVIPQSCSYQWSTPLQ